MCARAWGRGESRGENPEIRGGQRGGRGWVSRELGIPGARRTSQSTALEKNSRRSGQRCRVESGYILEWGEEEGIQNAPAASTAPTLVSRSLPPPVLLHPRGKAALVQHPHHPAPCQSQGQVLRSVRSGKRGGAGGPSGPRESRARPGGGPSWGAGPSWEGVVKTGKGNLSQEWEPGSPHCPEQTKRKVRRRTTTW